MMMSRKLARFRYHGLVAVTLLTLLLSCTALDTDTVFSPDGTTTTIILVRHAEREPGLDPPLNEEGLMRALALAAELADDGVTAVFYPDLIRNRQTADPLVEASGAARREFSALEVADTKAWANNFVDEVRRDHAGGVVVWIGNTGPAIENVQEGNLQEIYARLGGTGAPPIRYASLYTVTLFDDRPPSIAEATYGGASSLD
jgi:hypothetical protein